MIDRARGFFAELAANNTTEWFDPRKDDYTRDIRKPSEFMADLFAEDLARHTGRAHRPKVFRINRDVRFSKDKTPYNAHLHMMWQPTQDAPAFFFGAAPGYLILGLAAMGLEGVRLTRYRALIDTAGSEVVEALDAAQTALGAGFSDWGTPPLRKTPKPYDESHPQADLLRRKSFAVSAPLPEGWRATGLMPSLNAMIPPLLPLHGLLARI